MSQLTNASEFFTKTPVTLEYGHLQIDLFSSGTFKKNDSTLKAPGIELDIGLLPDLESHFVMHAASSHRRGETQQYGYGDTELSLKYRLMSETENFLQVALYPTVIFPSGAPNQRIGNKGVQEKISVWSQKSWISWELSGGGGVTFNQGPKKSNYAFGGILLRKKISQNLNLGGEIYAKGKESSSDRRSLILNFGGNYTFSKAGFLLFSAGHSVAGPRSLVAFIGVGLRN